MATDAEIRAAGLYAVPDRRFLQKEFQLPTNTPTEEVTGSFGIPYTNAFTEGGGGGGQGGGKFGNQDMSDYKDFNMPGFDKPVRGFRNIASGMYQDEDGLNIQNLGINSFGMAGILEKAFGLKDEDEKPKYPGYFTDNKFGTLLKNPGTFKKYYAKQDKAKQDKIVDRKNLMTNTKKDKSTGTGQNDYQAPTIRSSKNKGFTTSSGMHGGKHYADGGRARYFFGGRVNYKAGGRTDAESQYGADSVGSYDSSANQSDRGQSYGGDNKPFVSNDNRVVTTDFISKNPSLTVDYTDPKNYASVYGKIGFDNILDNDDLTTEGNVTGEFGPIGYNTNFTNQGITGTNLTAGNFNADISPDMQVQNIGYSKGPFSISSDGQNTTAGLTFSYKNGGLAGLL